jgi:hypothetical protein
VHGVELNQLLASCTRVNPELWIHSKFLIKNRIISVEINFTLKFLSL